MRILCCGGPANGRYHDYRGASDLEVGHKYWLNTPWGDGQYELGRWPDGEFIFIHVESQRENEREFNEWLTDEEVENAFDFPSDGQPIGWLKNMINEAVADAELR